MSDLQRVAKVIDWLIFHKVVETKRELAEKLGYTESSLSQIVNGKVNLSTKFIKKLSKTDERINEEWLLTGVGSMEILTYSQEPEVSVVKENRPEYIKKQQQGVPYEFVEALFAERRLHDEMNLELIRQNAELIYSLKKLADK